MTTGTPAQLNVMLARGDLDVAPCSSIEVARHSREYLALDGVCIGSRGPVDSILLVARAPLDELDGARVALSQASATSQVLVRILLEVKAAVQPVYYDFDDAGDDPLDRNEAEAALFIGDPALQRRQRPGETVTDLGAAWTEWTGLPFVYALWMVRAAALDNPELPGLCREILEARERATEELPRLATEAAQIFDLDPQRLLSYWRTVRYRYTDAMAEGLQRFLRHALELDIIPAVPEIRYYRP